MSKLPDCALRTTLSDFGKNEQLVYSGGMNFLVLGADAALCHHCRLLKAGLDELLHCPHSDIYTTMQRSVEGHISIEYYVECYVTTEQKRCRQCPEIRENQSANDQSTSRSLVDE